jgi:hypothetical protein
LKIGGHGLRDHLQLVAPLFGLIAAVWALRLILALAGAPHVALYFSVTLTGAVSVLLAVLLIHMRHFGGYPNVVMAVFLLQFWQQFLIVMAIAFTTLTGIQTVYAAPEFAHQLSPAAHMIGHLTFGIGIGTLFGTVMGSVVLWMLRRLVPMGSRQQSR